VHHDDGVVLCIDGVAYETKRTRLSMAYDLAQLDETGLPSLPAFEWDPDFKSGKCEVVSAVDGVVKYRDNVIVGKLNREPDVIDRLARRGQYQSESGMSGSPVLSDGKFIGVNAAGDSWSAYILPFVSVDEWGDVLENYEEWYHVSTFDRIRGVKYHSLDEYWNVHVYHFFSLVAAFSILAFNFWRKHGANSVYHDVHNDARIATAAKGAEAGVLNYHKPVSTVGETILGLFPMLLNKYAIAILAFTWYSYVTRTPLLWHSESTTWLGWATEHALHFFLYFLVYPANKMRQYELLHEHYSLVGLWCVTILIVNIIVGIPAWIKGRSDLVVLRGEIKTNQDLMKLSHYARMSYFWPSSPMITLIYYLLWISVAKYFVGIFSDARWHSGNEEFRLADLFVFVVVLGCVYFVANFCQVQKAFFTKEEAVAHSRHTLEGLYKTTVDKLIIHDTKGSITFYQPGNSTDRLSKLKRVLTNALAEVHLKTTQCKSATQERSQQKREENNKAKRGRKEEAVTLEDSISPPNANEVWTSNGGTVAEWIELETGLKALQTSINKTVSALKWTEADEDDLCGSAVHLTQGLKCNLTAQQILSDQFVKIKMTETVQITPEPYASDWTHTVTTGCAIFLACFYSSFGRAPFQLICYLVLSSVAAVVLSYTQKFVIFRPLVMGKDDQRDYMVRFLYCQGYVVFGVRNGTDHPEIDFAKAATYNGPPNFITLNKVIMYVTILCAIFTTDQVGVRFHASNDPLLALGAILWLVPLVALLVFGMTPFGYKKIRNVYCVVVGENGNYKKTEIDLEQAIPAMSQPVTNSVSKKKKKNPKDSASSGGSKFYSCERIPANTVISQ